MEMNDNKQSNERKTIVAIACGAIGVAVNIIIITIFMFFGAQHLVEIWFKYYIFFFVILVSYFLFRNRLPMK